jgi:hypothetical protein
MAETAKRTECVKVCFEERLFIDLNRIAIREERRLADLCYMVLRRYAYGNANGAQPPDQNTDRASESL